MNGWYTGWSWLAVFGLANLLVPYPNSIEVYPLAFDSAQQRPRDDMVTAGNYLIGFLSYGRKSLLRCATGKEQHVSSRDSDNNISPYGGR